MYVYEELKGKLFSEEAQVMFLAIRDKAQLLLKQAGAFRMEEAIKGQVGDSWIMLACVDRLIELGEIVEVTSSTWGQHRIFTFKN